MELFQSILWVLDLVHGSKLIGESDLKVNEALIHRSVWTLPAADRRLCESCKPQSVCFLSNSLPSTLTAILPLGGTVCTVYLQSCEAFKSHTFHCGEAGHENECAWQSVSTRCTFVTGVRNCFQMCWKFVSTLLHSSWHPIYSLSHCILPALNVCHHTSSATSTQFPVLRAWLATENLWRKCLSVMTLQRQQVWACAKYNRCSSHVAFILISI